MSDTQDAIRAGECRALFDYDAATGLLRWRVSRANSVKVGDVAGNRSGKGHWVVSVNGHRMQRARMVWLWVTGALPADQVDHKNRVRDDDRWENLRLATPTQNLANRKYTNAAGARGVSFRPKRPRPKQWDARITSNGKTHHLGWFETKEAASAAYRAKAKELFGEYLEASANV